MLIMGGETVGGEQKGESAHVVTTDNDTENVVLSSRNDKQNMAQLLSNCAVLDCACSSTVCGKRCLNCYLDSSDEHQSKSFAMELKFIIKVKV